MFKFWRIIIYSTFFFKKISKSLASTARDKSLNAKVGPWKSSAIHILSSNFSRCTTFSGYSKSLYAEATTPIYNDILTIMHFTQQMKNKIIFTFNFSICKLIFWSEQSKDFLHNAGVFQVFPRMKFIFCYCWNMITHIESSIFGITFYNTKI